MTHRKDAESSISVIPVLLSALALIALLLFRVSIGGDNPFVLADEFSYAAESHALWLHQPPPNFVPGTGNWLYLAINSTDFAFNANFMTLARVWNVLALVLCGLVFFQTFRKLAGSALAGGIAALVAVTFGGTYARLYMPEAMQFAVVVMTACAFYALAILPSLRNAIVLGAALGLGILTKVHALLLIPCFLAGICLVAYVQRLPLRSLAKLCAAFFVATLLTVYVLRAAISGQYDLNLLGNFYGGIAKDNGAGLAQLPRYGYVIKRHLVTLFVMFAPVIAVTLIALTGLRRESTPLSALRCTIFTMVLAVGGMLLVSVVFTVSVAGSGPYESMDRIHGRYYEHLFMVTAMLGAVGAAKFQRDVSRLARAGIVLFVIVALVLSYKLSRHIGWQNSPDYAAVFGLYWEHWARKAALIVGCIALVLLGLRPKLSSTAVTAALCAAIAFSAYEADRQINGLDVNGTDRAAKLIVAANQDPQKDKVVILSTQPDSELYRAAFHLIRYDPAILILPPSGGDSPSCPTIAATATWVLMAVAKPALTCENFIEVARFNDAAVYTRPAPPASPR